MTSAFVDGAELMAHACGAPDYRFAVIEHPISSATDAELRERAGRIVRQAEKLVLEISPRRGGSADGSPRS